MPLEEAMRRLTALPAANLELTKRGQLEGRATSPTWWCSIPATIGDHATFETRTSIATGVKHVFVNGVQVLKDGEHTGQFPGRALSGPGRKR